MIIANTDQSYSKVLATLLESHSWQSPSHTQSAFHYYRQRSLDEGMKVGEFPKVESHLLFKAIGGSFHGILLMGDEQQSLSRQDIEDLFSRLLSTTGSPHA